MTPEQALEHADELNKTGKHRDGWHYYPAYLRNSPHGLPDGWFVMRRPKATFLAVAIYADGKKSIRERLTPDNE